jgi:hypothetical protein
MSYEPPENNIHFKFTSSGYEPPSFDNVNFRFPGLAKDLGVYISPVSEDYIKECQTYVFGYSDTNIQIVNHSCVYTGFRDLGMELTYAYRFSDISVYLKQTFPGQKDLFSILKGYASVQSDIFNIIKAVHREIPIDLYAYAKTVFPLNIDIISYVNIFQKHDISIFGILKGWVVEEQLDMLGAIKPKRKLEINLDKYLKSNERTFLDLNLEVYKIFKRSPFDIDANLHGWQTLDLLKNITPFDYSNLDVYLRCTYMDNITAYLFAITPVDIGFSLRGWQDANLYANIVNMEYPYYITSYIFGVGSVNLPVFIQTRKGIAVENDLSVFLDAYYTSDLQQIINLVPAQNLSASIFAKGLSSTLICKIYPKVVFSRTRLIVSYLEGRDLGATINYSCFNSGYSDINITLNSMFSLRLGASIFGSDGSNIQDMYARVNYNTYSVENTIGTRFVKDYKDYFTSLKLKFNKVGDMYGLSFLNVNLFNNSKYSRNLFCEIYPQYIEKNIGATIRGIINPNYKTKVVERVITLHLKDNIEEWRRILELSFGSYMGTYTFFEGDKKVYPDEIGSNWTIVVKGYSLDNLPKGLDRVKLRRKFVFNLKKYKTIDEAIRDIIDRASLLQSVDLGAEVVIVSS